MYIHSQYTDGVGNIIAENSSIFFLVQIHLKVSAAVKLCFNKILQFLTQFTPMTVIKLMYIITSVYPAKRRSESGTTKLGSEAQMHLRRSRIEVYGPRPQARARLARATVVLPASA